MIYDIVSKAITERIQIDPEDTHQRFVNAGSFCRTLQAEWANAITLPPLHRSLFLFLVVDSF